MKAVAASIFAGRIVLLAALLTMAADAAAAEGTTRPESSPRAMEAPRPKPDDMPIRGAESSDTPAPASSSYSSGLGFWRLLGALAVVLAAIFAFRWASQRLLGLHAPADGSRAVQVLSRSMISPRQQLLLLQVGRRLVLVANSGSQVSPLCEITDPDEVAALTEQLHQVPAQSSRPFLALFGRAGAAYEAPSSPTSADAGSEEPADPSLAATRSELGGLLEKVRLLSRNYRKG